MAHAGKIVTVEEDMPALLDAFDMPLLLIDGFTVERANAAARRLLGTYVEGEDLRLAIRHPDATGLLSGSGEGSAQLGGLGDPERRWEMEVRPLGQSRRLVRLIDHSQAAAAERMRTDFVANASHELRTPLATLMGFIETLEEANGTNDAAIRMRFLGIMGGEARRMQRLIDDLMSLSRIEADRYVRPRESIDLASTVRVACAEIEAGGIAGGRLRLTLPDSPLLARADSSQISQLIHNIVGNALKYGREGGEVKVTLQADDGSALLLVEDEGEGISRDHLPRLTERFYRVDAGRSRAVGGTGLGLAIVKHIVERHRGRLDIASTPGIGTRVSVVLPRDAEIL
ncbi:two-component system phosphate regulon sensor histidine kinase PhoR [Sphingomonas vulcanisoli]|uniref:histidine kinase n=1 Tax=Sphingomonas vulcanisoli TaxID=1658060 RepID=A0ABX0TNR6_9SPHN|nr:ATP-binding protein [Sphingomonas vulcanisoli]NIJ07168.1 two-component system phosphate regulon sensor histidine kinase PhoR [Sphingomonas vulcanisoli]